jgi:Rps23 Pro-64 3,4-dihydroxylase Tpa1-like proline 4-hydroxylase
MNNFLINYDKINIEECKTIFDNKKRLKIDNILKPDLAEFIYKFIINEKSWNLAAGINKLRFDHKLEPKNQKKNDEIGRQVNKAFSLDQFSYIFHRSMNNSKNVSMVEKSIRESLNSPDFISLLNSITNLNLTKLSTLFLSRYLSGHFLSVHSDKGNGKLAFVINLTKEWRPQYGGSLTFVSSDRLNVIESFLPGFNNMILFQVEGNGIDNPHLVQHISPNVLHARYAISGWFE